MSEIEANKCELGKRLRHKEFKDILEVQEVNGEKLWINLEWEIRLVGWMKICMMI